MYIVIGLGNPGEEYENTRHNTGRIIVENFSRAEKLGGFSFNKKTNSLEAKGEAGGEKVLCILPETFMNKSGSAAKCAIKSQKAAEKMIVVHDDIDLPLGRIKVSFGRGSGGHKGVESVIKAVKTRNFFRIRIGVSPETPAGKLKKPRGEKSVLDFLMGEFKPKEAEILKKVSKLADGRIEDIIRRKTK